jgi:hypothetical protein
MRSVQMACRGSRLRFSAVGAAGILIVFFSVVRLHSQSAGTTDYDRQVHPILAARCLACHSQEKRSGGLSLATYLDTLEGGRSGAAIKPGDSANSLIIHRISGSTLPRMPFDGAPLSDAETAVLRSWIDQGARATPTSAPAKPKWEAPLALERPSVPESISKNWTAPLDRFVAAYLAEHGIPAPEPVSDTVFARRAYLDVWGLLPAPDELRSFLNDQNPRKRETLVRNLLADNQKYAENWISFWNDLLRNDEGVSYYSETASRESITEWLLGALKSNLPYDQFVTKLLNPASPGDPAGFLIGVNWRGTVSASQTPALQAAQNTAQIFLGLNLKCNSCHDSFISKWKLRDAYALASYFSPEEKLQLYRCDIAQQQFAEPAFLFPELNRNPPSSSIADRRATIASIFTDPHNGRLPRTLVNRIWDRLLGHGIVANVDEMDGEPWSPGVIDWLASDFIGHGYDMKELIATILLSRTYQMPAVARTAEQRGAYVFRGPEIRRLTAEQFADAIGAITGYWHTSQPRSSTGVFGPAAPGVYTREWSVAASSLTRALGRPIRDQVYSTRETQATTLQALELVNGETLTHWLFRGAQQMLGVLPPSPNSLFNSAMIGRPPPDRPAAAVRTGSQTPGGAPPARFDIDISNAKKLWLIVQDAGSTAPDKAEPVWANAEFAGPHGTTPLSSLKPLVASGIRTGSGPIELGDSTTDGVRVQSPSRIVYDVGGKGFTRLRGIVGLENSTLTQGEFIQGRFFIFDQEPDMDRLVPPKPATPVPAGPSIKTAAQVVDRVFWYALGRMPSPAERHTAELALRDPVHPDGPSAEALADLLWAVLMKPEFQLIY